MKYRFKTTPFKHQYSAWDKSHNKKYYALFMEMGTGKTKVIIDTGAYLYDNGHIEAMLIFGNKGSYTNWNTDELPLHMPEHITYYDTYWDSSARSELKATYTRLFKNGVLELKIFVMNIEALAHARSYEIAEKFVRNYKTLVVVDESSTIKNIKAKRTKAALKLGVQATARRIMTGSPITKNPLDLYSQCEFLKPGLLGFTSYYSFRSHYAELIDMKINQGMRSFKKITGFKNLSQLTETLNSFAFIIKKQDCLDLPPKIYETYKVEMTPEQSQFYSDLKRKSLIEIEELGTQVSTKTILTKLLRLHQLVCGHLIDDEGNVINVKNNRLSSLCEILDECSGKAIIWANYRADIHAITKKLTDKYGEDCVCTYFGDTSQADRDRARDGIQNGNMRFLVGNPQTGGYGITLTAVNTVIYYSNNFDLEKRMQSEDRAHRIGQKKSVTYIDLYCPKTIDEKILLALKNKKDMADTVIISNWREYF